MILNNQPRADGGRTSSEFALPERITQDHGGRRTASQVVFCAEKPSSGGQNPERQKELAGYSEYGGAAYFGALPNSQICVCPAENARKCPLVVAELLEKRIAEIVRILRNAEVHVGDFD